MNLDENSKHKAVVVKVADIVRDDLVRIKYDLGMGAIGSVVAMLVKEYKRNNGMK